MQVIIKGENPSFKIFIDIFFSSLQNDSFILVTFKSKNKTNKNDTNWDIRVAKAAPLTPMLHAYINKGSRPTLITHPKSVTHIANVDLPWAMINWVKPSESIEKKVPPK